MGFELVVGVFPSVVVGEVVVGPDPVSDALVPPFPDEEVVVGVSVGLVVVGSS